MIFITKIKGTQFFLSIYACVITGMMFTYSKTEIMDDLNTDVHPWVQRTGIFVVLSSFLELAGIVSFKMILRKIILDREINPDQEITTHKPISKGICVLTIILMIGSAVFGELAYFSSESIATTPLYSFLMVNIMLLVVPSLVLTMVFMMFVEKPIDDIKTEHLDMRTSPNPHSSLDESDLSHYLATNNMLSSPPNPKNLDNHPQKSHKIDNI